MQQDNTTELFSTPIGKDPKARFTSESDAGIVPGSGIAVGPTASALAPRAAPARPSDRVGKSQDQGLQGEQVGDKEHAKEKTTTVREPSILVPKTTVTDLTEVVKAQQAQIAAQQAQIATLIREVTAKHTAKSDSATGSNSGSAKSTTTILKDVLTLFPPPKDYTKDKDINQYFTLWMEHARNVAVATQGQDLPKLNFSLAASFSSRCGPILHPHAEDLIALNYDDMPDFITFIDSVRERFTGDAGGMSRELELNKLFNRDKNTNLTKYFEVFDITTRTMSHLSPEILAFIFRMGLPVVAVNAVMRALYASRRQDDWKNADVQQLKQFVLQFDTESPRKDDKSDKSRQDTNNAPNNHGNYKHKGNKYKNQNDANKTQTVTTPGQASPPNQATSNFSANTKPQGYSTFKPNQSRQQQSKGSVGTITHAADLTFQSDVEHSDGQEFISIPTSLPTRQF
jgi:hypothetical protein